MLHTTAIGERIRAARYAAKLTQTELAADLYSKSYISAVERAKLVPSFQALQYLAARLAVPIAYLLGEDSRGNETLEREAQARKEQEARHLIEAEALLQQGRYAEAIARFEQIGRKERVSCVHEQYARFLADQGRYQDAYEQMQMVLY